MIKLSIILPCFNVGQYVGRCLDSLLSQDFSDEEYEIICVNDCSTDNTRDIIQQYMCLYSNIVLFEHTENKTAGGARNTGLLNSRGEYIWFVDPDDTVIPNVMGTLYTRAKFLDTDILAFNINVVKEDGRIIPSINMIDTDDVLSCVDLLKRVCPQKMLYGLTTVYKSVYSRTFLIENNIRFPEIRSSQDVVFVWESIIVAKRASSISSVCYNYIRRDNSTTGEKGKRRAKETISASLLYPDRLFDLCERYDKVDPAIINNLLFAIRNTINDSSRFVLKMNRQERILFYKLCEKNHSIIDRMYSFMNRKTKVIFNYNLSRPIWNMCIDAYIMHEKFSR